MKPLITIEEKPDYLRFYVEGVDSLQFSIDYWTTISEECRKRGYKKILIVENLQGQLSTVDMYDLCERLPDLFRGLMLAFVDQETDHFPENRFGEHVASNRGCSVQVFRDEKQAEHWLISS